MSSLIYHPKVSVITVCFNAVETIEETILSVFNQTYDNVEYIVVDGASTDGTNDVISRYSNRISQYISEPDEGLYDALNKGVMLSSGDWIGVMNCGDVFHDNNVLKNVFLNIIDENVGVIYGNCVEINNKSVEKRVCFAQHAPSDTGLPPQYRHGASFVRCSVHKNFLFDIDKKCKYDYGLDYLQIYTMYKSGVLFEYKDIIMIDYLKEGMSNHSWKNKYLRTLTENDGKKNIMFFIKFVKACIMSAMRKMNW